MGKQLVEQPVVKPPRTKKLVKRPLQVETVSGERPYEVQPLKDYEQYLEIKSKRYNRYRKQVIRQIVLDKFQVKKAVEAVKAFEDTHRSDDLFENEGFLYLEIVLSVVPEEYSIRPVQIPLPVPIYSEQFNTRSAIFVTDPQRDYKDKIQDLTIPTVAKVIGFQKLKKNYKMLKDKRSLIYSYDLFFCDWRIYNLLRRPAGKLFYERKRFPFPIDCEGVPAWKKEQFGEDYAAYLNDLNNYTYLMIGNGPVQYSCIIFSTVKIGRIGMEVRDLVKNVIHGVYNTLPHLMSKTVDCSAVRQLSIKTSKSPSLPIFNQLSAEEIASLQQ